MITTGIFPQLFKISKIIPLYKKGDHSLLTNYRPISLLPTISKVFERIIYDQMYFIYTVLIERAIHNSMCSNALKYNV